MTDVERYQKMASDLREKARKERSEFVRSQFESLAQCYATMAGRSEKPADQARPASAL
jgi:hypothetical protein